MTVPCSHRRFERAHLPVVPSTTRASDEERDEVVQALAQHHVDGRLSTDEFEERAAWQRSRRRWGISSNRWWTSRRWHAPTASLGRIALVPILLVAAFIAAVVVTHGRAVFGLLWIGVVLTVLRTRGPWRRPNHRRYAAS